MATEMCCKMNEVEAKNSTTRSAEYFLAMFSHIRQQADKAACALLGPLMLKLLHGRGTCLAKQKEQEPLQETHERVALWPLCGAGVGGRAERLS